VAAAVEHAVANPRSRGPQVTNNPENDGCINAVLLV
jgi:ribosomal protein S8E